MGRMFKIQGDTVAKRQDGKETRRRVLNAASKVFAEKGYRNAKVSEICKLAGANVAAVNYYFGDKAGLYEESWRHAYLKNNGHDFLQLSDGDPVERLREYIQILLKNFLETGELRSFSRLYLRELLNPTGLIKDSWHELVKPNRQLLHGIIGDIAGKEVDAQSMVFCELSIVNQCHSLLTIKENDLMFMLGQPLDLELIKRLANHIVEFSLAGIKAVCTPREA